MHKRKIGLDIGSKSCGIALSDPLNITAQGKENFKFENKNWKILLLHLDNYFNEYQIDKIIIGYPTFPSGDKSQTTLMVEEVEKLLKEKYTQEIIRIPEDNSTKKAHKIMIECGLTRKKRKNFKDQIAAQIILSDYLSLI